jgi:hypothetical protein
LVTIDVASETKENNTCQLLMLKRKNKQQKTKKRKIGKIKKKAIWDKLAGSEQDGDIEPIAYTYVYCNRAKHKTIKIRFTTAHTQRTTYKWPNIG